MANEQDSEQSPPGRGTRPSAAVNTLLKIQGQFEEWEERERMKRRRFRMLFLVALLAAVGVIAAATLLPGGDERSGPAPKAAGGTQTKAPQAATSAQSHPTRFVTTLTAEPRLARYADGWRARIEAVAAAQLQQDAQLGAYGSVVLTTFIRPDGSVSRIEISRSSGQQSLDDAAVRIVRAAAPFAPLPEDIRRDTGMLAIVRTFSFERGEPRAAR